MADVLWAERVEIDGIPLSTPAYEVTDFSELWDIPDVIGSLDSVPYRRGVVPFRRQWSGKRVRLPILVAGTYDENGDPHASERGGLILNRDALVRDVIRPLQVETGDGTRTLRYLRPDGLTLAGPCSLAGRMSPTPVGPGAFRAAIEVELVEGGLRAETPVDVTSDPVASGGSGTLTVPNPGTDYQDSAAFTLTGDATAVTLTNLTANAGGDVFLTFGGDLTGDVEIDTGAWTAERSGVSVVGLVIYSGFERWLPLVPGDNEIQIEPTGGSATLQVIHSPFYA